MAKKVTQAALSAAIAKHNREKKCPYCVNGKVNKATCGECHGSGTRS